MSSVVITFKTFTVLEVPFHLRVSTSGGTSYRTGTRCKLPRYIAPVLSRPRTVRDPLFLCSLFSGPAAF